MDDKKLVEYIKEHISKGYSKEQIKSFTIAHGIDKEQVLKAFRNIEQSKEDQSSPKQIKSISMPYEPSFDNHSETSFDNHSETSFDNHSETSSETSSKTSSENPGFFKQAAIHDENTSYDNKPVVKQEITHIRRISWIIIIVVSIIVMVSVGLIIAGLIPFESSSDEKTPTDPSAQADSPDQLRKLIDNPDPEPFQEISTITSKSFTAKTDNADMSDGDESDTISITLENTLGYDIINVKLELDACSNDDSSVSLSSFPFGKEEVFTIICAGMVPDSVFHSEMIISYENPEEKELIYSMKGYIDVWVELE